MIRISERVMSSERSVLFTEMEESHVILEEKGDGFTLHHVFHPLVTRRRTFLPLNCHVIIYI